MTRTTWWSMILLAIAGGCSIDPELITTVPLEDVPQIQLGWTLEQLEDAVERRTYWRYRAERIGNSKDRFMASISRPLTHQFTVRFDDMSLLCVSSRVIQPELDFVFANGRLARVHWASMHDPWNPDRVARWAWETPSLSLAELPMTVKQITEEQNARTSASAEPNPVFLLFPRISSRDKAAQIRDVELQEKYDPLQLQLGMSSAEVERILGPPVVVGIETDAGIVFVYGERPARDMMSPPLVAVTYSAGTCVAIYSHRFVSLPLREAASNALSLGDAP